MNMMNKETMAKILKLNRRIRMLGRIGKFSLIVARLSALVAFGMLLANVIGLLKTIPGR